MVTSYSNPLVQKSLILVISLTLILLQARNVNSATKALSFNFTTFPLNSKSITLQGNAEILGNGILALTSHTDPKWNTGRALYATPVRIWDNATGNVASFVTSFSFVVEDVASSQANVPADGFIFFLAPQGTTIPPNSNGSRLGVVDGNNAFNQIVGVEFDSYTNTFDPPNGAHVGIDVNSLISLKTVKWNRVSGSLVKVSIIYDSLATTLSVAVTNPNGRISTVSQVVDLKAVLPEKVNVGFSATTTDYTEKHDIYSWSFTSTLETGTITENISNDIASYA